MRPHTAIADLCDMLTYCRPAGSGTESLFRDRYLLSLPGAYEDIFHNIHVQIGDDRRVLFSSHTDTVHRTDGRQTIAYDARTGTITLSRKAKRSRNCLGADDTVGCWIMRSMILAGVPGSYVFHHAEERGGVGSGDLARSYHDWLAEHPIAVAFDRRGTSDVITYQNCGRCCSDTFAHSLSDALNVHGLQYTPCDRGIYTDTAEYVSAIAECTNVSVGYQNEHTPSESVNVAHADRVRLACLSLDWNALTVERVPHDPSEDWSYRELFRYADWDTIDETETIDHSCYLDPQFAAIQRALGRLQ
jgi:hypothetical protein